MLSSLSSVFLWDHYCTAQPPLDFLLLPGKEIAEGIVGEANLHLFAEVKGYGETAQTTGGEIWRETWWTLKFVFHIHTKWLQTCWGNISAKNYYFKQNHSVSLARYQHHLPIQPHQFHGEGGKKHHLPTVTAVLGKEQTVLEEASEEDGVETYEEDAKGMGH